MLTGKATKRLDLPHEPGEWIDVRLPSWPVLVRARNLKQRQAVAELAEWSEEGMRKARAAADEGAARGTVPPNEDEYDWGVILEAAITGWSYSDPLTPEHIQELDEETARFVVRACVPERHTEDDLKNGSLASTSSLTARRKP